MSHNKILSHFILAVIIFLLFVSLGYANSTPLYINYQGRLIDQATGDPIDGVKLFTFSFYNTEIGGTSIYKQTQEVNITNGVFSVSLGKGEGFYDGNTVEDGIPEAVFTKNGAQYLGITTDDSQTEMSSRQLIARVAYSIKAEEAKKAEILIGNQAQYLVPKGAIIMWSGAIDSIPDGWALCDGNNNTPDLHERFIMGVASGDNPGKRGGASSYTLTVSQLPSHSHSGSTSSAGNHSHSGSTSTNGEHTHRLKTWPAIPTTFEDHPYPASINWTGAYFDKEFIRPAGSHSHSLSINSAGNHTHSFTTNVTGSGASIDNRPAYYALAFIMKL